jgi:clostripain
MQNPFKSKHNLSLSFPFIQVRSITLQFSDEIEAQRRRKGSGPTGRAEAPVRREGGGGSTGGGGLGPSSSGGGWLPSTGGTRAGGGCIKLPIWLIIILFIVILLIGGKGILGLLLGGGSGSISPVEQAPLSDVATEVPTIQSAPVAVFTPPAGSKAWTVILYQDADDQVLEQDIFTDFNEAERIGSNEQVNIVAQLDRFRGAFSGDGNWSTTRRYYVTQDNDLNTIHSQVLAEGEANMSDPATLVDFATWAIQTFPADHYMLILSDHGMGWPGGWTDPSPQSSTSERAPIAQAIGNAMYLDMVDDALGEIRQQAGIDKFDIIGMDACLMGQLEVLSALEPHARYAITSEETEPSLGWAYTAFLQTLVKDPGMNAADLSKLVVQSYISDDQRITDSQARAEFLYQMGAGAASADQLAQLLGKDATLAAFDLSKVSALMSSVNDLAYAMENVDQSTIAGARSYALSFTSVFGKSVPPAYIDLGNFVQILAQQSGDATIQQFSNQVLSSIRQTLIAEKHGSSKRGATGVAIYFPNSTLYRSPLAGPQSYTMVANRFTQNSLWDDFLAFHYNGRTFEASSREPVIPDSSFASRAPGIGQLEVSALQLSTDSAAPGQTVTMRTEMSGSNIGYIYLFIGYYDQSSNSIFVADTDFLESPDTRQVDGVYYPQWGNNGSFTLKYDWDLSVFKISDGQNSTLALFTPQQYGATAADAIYSVDGVYTFASGGSLNARLNFRDGKMVNVFGITGQGDTGAPHEIIPQVGDTFTILEKWLSLDAQGNVQNTSFQQGQTTLNFNGQPFTWEETYAPQGDYMIGFVVTDLDGNSREVYSPFTAQ